MADQRKYEDGEAGMAARKTISSPGNGKRRLPFMSGLAAAGAALALSGCSTNPYTGETQFAAYDDAQLSQASASAWQQLQAQTPTLQSGQQYQRVMRVWNRVAQATPKAGESWDVQVFDSEEVNAFVMPGNRVGVYTGLIDLVENDDQLAAVLGHEVAHAIYRHANQRATRQAATSTAVQVGASALGGSEAIGGASAQQIASLGSAAANLGVVLPYSRSAELEADLAGVDYMQRAGYDPRAAIRLWELMQQNNSQRTADFLSTHPNPDLRQQRIREYIQQKGY